ncbi:MAG TPA: exo-beta-N-acetylmuramidase NamZ domain-containing protein [Pyrinomonadaceae bacterium]|nr:exo-beta-N-acetylmuramidase NamZ domain-containing protein [Pyrinomonadaceae bacterium]
MNAWKLNQIEQLVLADIKDKKLPGAVVIVGRKGKIVYRQAFGNRSLVPTVEKMTVDTIFDVASLTKPVATATSIMILVEQGKLRLNDTIGKFIPEIDDEQAKRVTILQLLTHTSGYRPDFDLREKWTGREGMLAALKVEKLRAAPGTRFVYSDIGFIVLEEILYRVSKAPVSGFFADEVAAKLDIYTSGFFVKSFFRDKPVWGFAGFRPHSPAPSDPFTPETASVKSVAPTEDVKGQNSYSNLGLTFEGNEAEGKEILRAKVHDPTAYRMGGIAGHAGLFSTADDLARYCQMLLNGGVAPASPVRTGSGSDRGSAPAPNVRGKRTAPVVTAPGSHSGGRRIMSAQTVARMTTPYVISEDGATRGLGWDMNTSFSQNRGDLFPLGSFGHTGFTGTSIWIDRVSQTFVVFLSNRVHPDGKGDVTPLRAKVATVVASAIEDVPVEAHRLAESMYQSQVAAQIPKFKAQVEAASRTNSAIRNPQSAIVYNGIDILERDGFKDLDGKRIGLVTNHTGRNLAGKPTIDVLFEAKNLKLVSLFAPEHGIRGELDTEKIDDAKDEKTGLPVYSLYKDGMRRPKPEQLKDLDAIVYDIQDIGTRFYTYTATLKNVMEEAAKLGKPIYVLDRPNPINGVAVEGPLAEEDKLTFIAAHTTPVRYGLTIGELGQLMNAERQIGADLRVIKMENWTRAMWFDETGQTWVNPSPNMRSLAQATLYPGIGLLEVTNVSVGRGTDTPFEIVGAPWLDGQRLAKHLNERGLPGVRFVPVRFKPKASVFKDEQLGGINVVVTNRNTFESVRTGLEVAAALRKLYPNEWLVDRYARLLVNAKFLDLVKRGETPETLNAAWQKDREDFEKRRAPYLLYK